jgi:hypothetical protein
MHTHEGQYSCGCSPHHREPCNRIPVKPVFGHTVVGHE